MTSASGWALCPRSRRPRKTFSSAQNNKASCFQQRFVGLLRATFKKGSASPGTTVTGCNLRMQSFQTLARGANGLFHLLGLAVTRPPLSLPWNSGVGWRDWGSPLPSQGRHFGPDRAAGPHGMAPYLGRGLAIEVRGGAGDPRAQDSSCGGTRASPLMKATWWATGLFPWVVAPPGGSQGTDVSGAPPL